MKITAEDVLKKLKEISARHQVPNPTIAIDSLALAVSLPTAELIPMLEELHSWQEIVLHRNTAKANNEVQKYAGVSILN